MQAFFVFSAGAGVSPVKSKVAVTRASLPAPFRDLFAGGGVLGRPKAGGGLDEMRQMTSGISSVNLSKKS